MDRSTKRQPLAFLFVGFLLLTLSWQAFYTFASCGGDPSGLFFTGGAFATPSGLSAAFVYPHSGGYDGQMYRLIAHDPVNRKGYWTYLDDPRYRSRRILIPALAALLGGASSRAVDLWYIAAVDLSLALGAVCFLRLAGPGFPPLLVLALFSLIPAVIASVDRMVLDGPAVAGFLGALVLFRERRWKLLAPLLVVLPLVRETAVLVNAGVLLAFLVRREHRRALWTAATVGPAAAWWWFVQQNTPHSNPLRLLSLPLWPQLARLFRLYPRPVSPPLNLLLETLDIVACLCLLFAFVWFAGAAIAEFRSGGWKEDTWIVLPSAALAAVASSWPVMTEGYAFLRVNSILLAWVILRMLRWRPVYAAAYAGAVSLALLVYRAGPILRLVGR